MKFTNRTNPVAFSTFVMLYNHHHWILWAQKETSWSQSSSSSFPILRPLTTTNLLSLSVNLPIMGISLEMESCDFISGFFFLSILFSRCLHVIARISTLFFSKNTIKKVRKQSTELEKIFAKSVIDKDRVFWIYKKLLRFNNKKTTLN